MKLLTATLIALFGIPTAATAAEVKPVEAGKIVITSCASSIRPSVGAVAEGQGSATFPSKVCFFERSGTEGLHLLVDQEAWAKQGVEGGFDLYRFVGKVQNDVIQPSTGELRVAIVGGINIGGTTGIAFGERQSSSNQFFAQGFQTVRAR